MNLTAPASGALGIDLGGTKIAAQVFGDDWACAARRMVATPDTYPALVSALAGLVAWGDAVADGTVRVGIGAAGALNAATGRILAANLVANGQRLPADLAQHLGRPVRYINDGSAFALSEAVFGAGRGHDRVFSLVLGTGVGGGLVQAGALVQGSSGTMGEVGHLSAPAYLVMRHALPVVACGCGRAGCIETLLSGPGLSRLAAAVGGVNCSAPQMIAARDSDPRMQRAWQVWCALLADLIHTLTMTVAPDCIVLGGGLSDIPGVVADVSAAVTAMQFPGFPAPTIRRAAGGADSGARGAAYAAWLAARDA